MSALDRRLEDSENTIYMMYLQIYDRFKARDSALELIEIYQASGDDLNWYHVVRE